MLYRPAETENAAVWNLKVEHQVFADTDVPEALEAGWVDHPHKVEDPDEPKAPRRGRPPKAESID